MEDQQIVELYWQRNELALSETKKKYGKYCYSIAYQILGNKEDAEECVNDVYFDAWNSMPPHHPKVLSTFLGKITRSESIDKWRKRAAKKRGGEEIVLVLDELSECVSSELSVEAKIEEAELLRLIETFLFSLPKTERQMFVCRYWYLDPILKIARQYNYSENTIKMKLYRIRKKLKRYLTKEGWL